MPRRAFRPIPMCSKRNGADAGEEGDERDLEDSHRVEEGIFSVLYTLSKQKIEESLKYTTLKLVLDFVQLFALVVNPAHGWRIDSGSV
jgi:hypothetical protein